MKTEEQMLRDELAQCEADGEQMSTELAKLREAVKTLRDSMHSIRTALTAKRAQSLASIALAATANLVED